MDVKTNYGIVFTGLWKAKPDPYTLCSHWQQDKMSIKWFRTLLIRNDSISDTLYTGTHDFPKCRVMENLDFAVF